jgi:hypothetical protein
MAARRSASGAWLVLVPPITMNGAVDSGQPLSEWRPAWSFGTQIDCEGFLQRQQFEVHAGSGPLTSASAQGVDQILAFQILKGQCVARDDPRLSQY